MHYGSNSGVIMQDLVEQLKQRKAKKVLLQLPEGLKSKSAEIAEFLEKSGIAAVVSAEACYGACDLRDHEAKVMGCDLLVHIGHNKFYIDFETAVPVLYYPYYIPYQLNGVDFSSIKEKRIGIVTTIQHMSLLKDVKDLLEQQGKEAVIGGQILGCWFVNAKKIEDSVDAFLFVGSGVFHPLGIKTEKPLYTYDLETHELEKLDLTLAEKRRYALIYKCKDAKTFGILVSTKAGQKELLGKAERVRAYLKEKDKRAFIIIMDEITEQKLQALRLDAYINTACPRLMDDHFTKPLINAEDVPKIFEDPFEHLQRSEASLRRQKASLSERDKRSKASTESIDFEGTIEQTKIKTERKLAE